VPGDVLKYFEYFKSNPPFEENGELKSNFDSLDYIPDSLQRNFSTTLDNLTEDEKNILTTASAFGYEFSINLLKDILNTDPLKLIRQLRSIYTKTNIISSLGAFTQFGVKTTIYRFSQAYYQRYFKDLIEHEEKINLNSLIQANYQKIYDNTTDENIIKELTPLIAIHSKEAEDFETSKKMFLQTAKIAFADGNQEAVEEATEQVKNMEQNPNSGAAVDMNSLNRMLDIFSNNKEYSEKEITEITESIIEENSNPNLVSTSTNILEFTDYRKQLVEIYLGKKFLETVNSIQQYYSSNESTLNISEKVQLICIALNSYIAQGDLDSSTQLYEKALIQFKSDEIDQISKCLLANSLALYEYKKNNKSSSRDLLLDAAKKSLRLPIEFKLLTLSNIYKFEFFDDMDEKQKIKLTIDHYSKKLQFAEFRKDLGFDS
jgi:hypothetical protein